MVLSDELMPQLTHWIAAQDYEAAAQYCQACIEAEPDWRDAYWGLGLTLCLLNNPDEAQSIWCAALYEAPLGEQENWIQELVAMLDTGATICTQTQQFPQALVLRSQIVELAPAQSEHYRQLGLCWEDIGNEEQAYRCYQQAIALQPNLPDAYNNLALIHQQRGDIEGAIAYYQQSLAAEPNFFKALSNLGLLYQKQDQLSDAVAMLERAYLAKPDSPDVVFNLGYAHILSGNAQAAVHYFQLRSNLQPFKPQCHAALVFCMLYGRSASEIFAEATRWASQFAPSVALPLLSNSPDPDRRLRIGYVSPDVRQHSVAYFFEPILKHHHAKDFEVFVYADVKVPDAITDRLQALTPHWRLTYHASDTQLIQHIQSDQIDILVDLAGYSDGNRLPVFGTKPAPVQVSYLGYAATTGLTQIDYRLSDRWADPVSDSFAASIHTESLIRLPNSFLCYLPDFNAPDVSSLPALEKGYVTLASFNHRAKMTEQVMATWAEILHQLPSARLMLKNEALRDPKLQTACIEVFEALGIDRDRIQCVGWLPKVGDHLALYHQVDIGLDTFPYAGTTTTCEALWMGVPVVTIAGADHRSRVGVSLLSTVGLTDWITTSRKTYIDKVVEAAGEQTALAAIRQNLRSQMRASPLCNGEPFVYDLEQIYRQIWQTWCANRI
jgi:protein O-GlcNAc transferase